jgi:hypothetical protein
MMASRYWPLSRLASLPRSRILAVAWINRDMRVLHSQAPNDLVKKLANGSQADAALKVARELLRLWGDNGRVQSHYSQHMYEHHLPGLTTALIAACGRETLQLLVDLLCQAETIAGKGSYSHLSMQPISHNNTPPYDICDALMTAVRQSAESLVSSTSMPYSDCAELLRRPELRCQMAPGSVMSSLFSM